MAMSYAAERDLIRRARDGDESAFEQLVAAFTPGLFRVVRRMTADTGSAEAILQETFWRIWQNLPRYDEGRPFFPYLVTIAVNLIRDAWRKDRRIDPAELERATELPAGQPSPETQVEDAELYRRLARAVEELPAPYRSVIALRYDADLSYESIASALDLPLNTVRTLLHRAKAALRAKMEEADE